MVKLLIWETPYCVFIDLNKGIDKYEVKRFPKAEYGDRLSENVEYHVERLKSITGFDVIYNTTKKG